jgi:hypothetical protein
MRSCALALSRGVTIAVLGMTLGCEVWAGAPVRKRSFDDAPAFRCVAELRGPEGLKSSVPGWGNTGNEAVKAAESAARYLAEMHRMVDAWPVVIFADELEREDGLEKVFNDWRAADPDDVHRLPGYTILRGDCTPVVAPKNTKWWWSVQWGETSIDGRDLGPTIERARRRSCGRDYQRKRITLFAASAGLGPGARASGFRAGLNVAFKQLSRCYLAEERSVIGHNRRRYTSELASDLFVCIGEPPGVDIGGPVQVALQTPAGVGSTVAGAAEAAWREWPIGDPSTRPGDRPQGASGGSARSATSVVLAGFLPDLRRYWGFCGSGRRHHVVLVGA